MVLDVVHVPFKYVAIA